MSEHPAIFYDGLTARRHRVKVGVGASELVVVDDTNKTLAKWRFADLQQQDAQPGRLRLGATTAPDLARLEFADDRLIKQILRYSPQIAKSTRASRSERSRIVFWSIATALSLIATAVYLVPTLADRIAPLVPVALERRLGDAVDNQVRAMIGQQPCRTPEGDAALAKLHAKLSDGAALHLPVEITVLQSRIPNALALPGGRIYVLSGLLDRSRHVNEVAGVLAHEIGHVAHRDGLRVLLQSGATSFLLGLLFGDVIGGGTLVMVSRTLVDSAYTRDAETRADAFAAERMLRQGHSPAPLAEFLTRLSKEFGGDQKAFALFSSHPLTEDRQRALSQTEPAFKGAPLLSEPEWQALKTICGAGKADDKKPQNKETPTTPDPR